MGKKNILIVEDEYIVAEDIKFILEDAGYNVIGITSNGREAIETLDRHPVDFSLIDIKLPGNLDGIETARIIKEKRQIPFMFITAYVDETTVNRAKLTSPYGYIVKPFSEKELLTNIELAFFKFQQDVRIKENHDYYYNILRSIGDGVIITDFRDKIVFMNSRAEHLLGYKISEVSGKDIKEIYKISPSEGIANRAILENKNGEKLLIEQTISQIIEKDNSGKEIVNGNIIIFKNAFMEKFYENGIFRAREKLKRKLSNITESLREESERLKTLQREHSISQGMKNLITKAIEKIPDVFIAIIDIRGEIIYFNRAVINAFLPEERSDTSDVKNDIKKLFKQISPETKRLEIENAFLERKSWKGNVIIHGRENIFHTISLSIFPIYNSSGRITHFILIGNDITKETELEKKLTISQKQEAIATLSGGIAHDFNNILGIIVGYADMLLYETPEKTPLHDSLVEILKASKRGKELVRQILSFSRLQEEKLSPINVTPILKERIKLLRTTLPKTIRIVSSLKAKEDLVKANSILIHQVIMNLCLNASHAIKASHGTIEITLENIHIDQDRCKTELKPGNYLQLSVKDSGCGIKASILDKIFEPYFTTKPMGEGTGLGLSVVYGIVKKLGGCIEVESNEGKGSIFKVTLPVMKNGIEKREVDYSGTKDMPGGSENILLIDDEVQLLKVWESILKRLGYTVTAMSDPHEALKYVRKNRNAIDLIITDLNMPGINGINLSKRILEFSPDMPIILCSGYGELVPPKEIREIGIKEFIKKPFELEHIANSIRRVLE